MTILHAGIDEAGYGPLIGPLSIVQVAVETEADTDLDAAFRQAGALVGDSKRIHTSGDLAPIEAIALAGLTWLSGRAPATAAECFALLGEQDVQRVDPWMAGAEALTLPVAAQPPAVWSMPGVRPRSLSGALIHTPELNQTSANGINRSALELERISDLLRGLPPHARRRVICDRLGGRRYYRDALNACWPDAMILIEEEIPARSAYRAVHAHGETSIAFLVGGEQASPLVALASCIAKYARELHLLLLNRWWSEAVPGLRPTAGYGTDAHRWLRDLGDRGTPHRDRLVRSTH